MRSISAGRLPPELHSSVSLRLAPKTSRRLVLRGFFFGQRASGLGHPNGFRDAQELQDPDLDPGWIEFVPCQAVTRRRGMRAMVIVPAFAERNKRHPPVVEIGRAHV